MAGRGSKASGAQTAPPGKHKRECHKCRYNGTGDDACLACIGPALMSYKGVNYVFLDDMPDPEGMVDKRIDEVPTSLLGEPKAREIRHVSKLPEQVEEKLIPLVASFTSLGMMQLVVLRSFWRGESEEVAPNTYGLEVAEYRRLLAGVRAKCPEVYAVCARVRKQHIDEAGGHVQTYKWGLRPKVMS